MVKPVRVLTVIRHPVGGIRTYLKYTYGHLSPEKYHFTILTIKTYESDVIRSDLSGFNVDLIEVQGKSPNFSLLWWIFRILRQRKFDIMHSHGFTAGLLTSIGGLFCDTPHIFTSHDVLRIEQFPPPFGAIKRKLISLVLSWADIVQSVSYDAQENLLSFLPYLRREKEKLRVIMNGVMPSKIRGAHQPATYNSLRENLHLSKDTILFGFLGRFVEQKGFIYLIDAVDRLSHREDVSGRYRILVVNDGSYIREYQSIIRQKNLQHVFLFRGFIPDVSCILREIDALVMPSLWEAYGLLAVEALIAGCPVIASNCIGLREVLEGTPAIVTRKGCSHDLEKALANFVLNPDGIRKKTVDFVPEAIERFNSEKTAWELDIAFTQLLSMQMGRCHKS